MGIDPPTATLTPATTIGPPSPVPTSNTGYFGGGLAASWYWSGSNNG